MASSPQGMIFRKKFKKSSLVGGWGLTPGWGGNSPGHPGSMFAGENEFQILADDCNPNNYDNGKIFLDINTEITTTKWGPGAPFKDIDAYINSLSDQEKNDLKSKYADRFGPTGTDFRESMKAFFESFGGWVAGFHDQLPNTICKNLSARLLPTNSKLCGNRTQSPNLPSPFSLKWLFESLRLPRGARRGSFTTSTDLRKTGSRNSGPWRRKSENHTGQNSGKWVLSCQTLELTSRLSPGIRTSRQGREKR